MAYLVRFSLIILLSLVAHTGFAQDPGGGGDAAYSFEVGSFIGNLLPNQIDGVDEIHSLVGARVGFLTGDNSTTEITFFTGNDNEVEWKQLSVGVRSDQNIDTMLAFAGVGLDASLYKAATGSEKFIGGGHLVGGLMADLSATSFFRIEMQFNFNPGTSLFIGGGLLFRL